MISSRHSGDIVFVDEPSRRFAVVATVARIFDLAFSLVYTLLAVLFLLELFQARRGTGFYELIIGLTAPFYGPFRDIVATGSFNGHPIAWSIVVAVLAYAILHGVIRGLLRLVAGRA